DPPLESQKLIESATSICKDMEDDLARLKKVTSRFSQIGSVPSLSPLSLNDIVNDIAAYFRMRMPFLHKEIDIKCTTPCIPDVCVNHDLIEWVFENLIKNSIDAIDTNNGIIEIKTEYIAESEIIRILFIDNGSGISLEQKKIFSPGYTTKKKGWGLGLTLAKRIVEDYHKGRIYVRSSHKNKGTVFCIDLPANAETTL
ncbi:MAG: HAMP domain-containing sensor histidine kinase, partial [Fibrobacter sp.]|nr:HAMP domain-containing sensor histidine kinase [Fibrobacter sp.]